MKSWKLEGPEKIVLTESEPTVLKENTIKIKVEEVLLGSSDINLFYGQEKQPYPIVPGRNAVGVVSEVYDKDKSLFKKMDRIAIEPFITCNKCTECLNGERQKCCELKYLGMNADGLLQNFVDVPMDQVHHLPDNLSNEQALFVSHVAFCLNIVDSLNLEKGSHVAIFASTKSGIILAQLVAYYQGVPVLISDNESLLEVARSRGIFYCVNPATVDVEKEILTITGGRMCRELVLFTDSDFSMRDLYNSAAMNANICLAGFANKDSRLSVAHICQKHLSIFCVHNGVGSFSSAINLLVTGIVNVDKLIGERLNFDNLDKELPNLKSEEMALKSPVVKVD